MRRALHALLVLLAFAASAALAGPNDKNPPWASLTADQQQILAPLASDWDKGLTQEQKVKWVGITKRYPAMKAEEQQRIQERMQKWAKLTPAQRWQAREQYRSIGKLAPDHRRDDLHRYWAEYQALSPEEKRMFDVPPGYVTPSERRQRTPAKKPGASQLPPAVTPL